MAKMTFSKNSNGYMAMLERFYPWILLMMIMALTWLLAQAFWLVVAPPKAPNLTPVPIQPNFSAQNNTANALDIFSQPQVMQAPTAPPPDIKVLGVTMASPARFSYAIINANGKTQNYRVHDTIEGSNYVLTAVGKDYIMVSSGGGQSVKIPFGQPFSLDQSEEIKAKMAQANGVSGTTGSSNNMIVGSDSAMTANPFSPNTGMGTGMANSQDENPQPTDNPITNSPVTNNPATSNGTTNSLPNQTQAAINSAVTGLQQDPAGYLSQLGVAATGQGYLVTDGMPAGLKNRLGLQTGDKVLSVNGQMVGQNPSQDAQLLEQVKQAGQAQIQVQRGDQTVTVRQSF